jgi:hypothetical protein
MGHLFEDEKPDYKRKIVKEYLKNKLVFSEYDDLKFEDIEEWAKKVRKEGGEYKKINVDVDVMETSEGFCQGPDEVRLEPYFEREENDKEYKERIEDEERQYKENLERERLKKEEYEEYVKDMEEMDRIKKKYHIG